MPSKQTLTEERKVEILEALRDDELFGLVSVRPDSEGVLMYESGASRVRGEPAIEVPHDDPSLMERATKTFSELLTEYGCTAKEVDGFTYIVVEENWGSKRP